MSTVQIRSATETVGRTESRESKNTAPTRWRTTLKNFPLSVACKTLWWSPGMPGNCVGESLGISVGTDTPDLFPVISVLFLSH